jgi:hypothetical protein
MMHDEPQAPASDVHTLEVEAELLLMESSKVELGELVGELGERTAEEEEAD